MTQQSKPRKRRSDRNHIIYQITAPTGELYVGVAVMDRSPMQSAQRRWLKHVSRAMRESRDWALCDAIRVHNADGFFLEVLDRVRGKAAAHQLERAWIQRIQPTLNTARTGKKG